MFKIFTRFLNILNTKVMALTAAAASVIGAGISAAASGASGAINANVNRKQFERAKDNQWSFYRAQVKDQDRMIREQREYESPTAQLQRLREAGLNPNMLSGAFGSPSASPMTPPSVGTASPVGSNPMPDIGSSVASGFQQFASGIDTATLTEIKLLNGQAQLEKMQTDTAYQKIINQFAEAKEKMTLAKGQQEIAESMARIKEYASKIDLNNSTIELNGHQIQLIDKNADLAEQNRQLAAAKTFMTNLNAEKLQRLMPYLEKQAQAEYFLTNARGEAAAMAANLSYEQASLASIQAMKELELLNAGYADALVADLKSQANYRNEDAKWIKRRTNTAAWQVGANYLQAVGNIALGAAGLYFGAGAMKAAKGPSGLYLPGKMNYGGQSWNPR